jgi:tetratricopeptide (TPR) repeat protein
MMRSGLMLVAALWLLALEAGPALAQPFEADVSVARASLAYSERRYDDALALLREALAEDPKNVEALYYTGLVLAAQQKLGEAALALEKARVEAPDDPAILYQLGVTYFAQKAYERAEPLLARLFKTEPRTDGLGYYLGYIRYRNGDYQGALEAFRAGRSDDLDIQQLSGIYSSLALAGLGLQNAAVAEAERAARIQPSSPLSGTAERLRAAVAGGAVPEGRFVAGAQVGFLYDTNVRVLPQPSHDPDAESARRVRNSHSPGALFGGNLGYSWLKNGPWESTVSYSFFQIIYSDVGSFNIQDQTAALAAGYRGALGFMPAQISAQYAFNYITLGGDEFLNTHTGTLVGSVAENSGNLSAMQVRLLVKNFSQDSGTIPAEIRDATNWMVGLLHVFRFADDRHLIRLGFQFDAEHADGTDFSYLGQRVLAGGQYTLPWGNVRLKYDLDLHRLTYVNRNALYPSVRPGTVKQHDTNLVHNLRVEKPLPYNLTLAADYTAVIARSNLPLYSFDRNMFTLTLSWRY